MEVETEADSNDITECPHGDKPSTGMFGFLILYSLHLFVMFALFSCCCSLSMDLNIMITNFSCYLVTCDSKAH